MARAFANVLGVDDGPFEKRSGAPVPLIGTVFANERFDGLVIRETVRDGDLATSAIASMAIGTRFQGHLQMLMLHGITFGGFDVVDLAELHETLRLPILIVARKKPNLDAVRRALENVADAEARWKRIESAGEMEPCGALFVQRAGLSMHEAEATLSLHTRYGNLPEPLRVAHFVGAAVVRGESHGSA